jgi:hypothetical protein
MGSKGFGDQSNNSCNNGSTSVNPFTECFFSIPPKLFTILATLIGILLIDNLDTSQQNSLGNFIVSVGQTMLTAAAQDQNLQSSDSQDNHIRQQIQLLKQQIHALEIELDNK